MPNTNKKKCLAEDYANLPTTSAKIRKMFQDGFSRTEIQKSGLKTQEGNPIRYQHVRNVLLQKLKG